MFGRMGPCGVVSGLLGRHGRVMDKSKIHGHVHAKRDSQ